MKNFEFDHTFLESLQYETPFFLFSKERVLEKFSEFKDCFPQASIHYSIKANFEKGLLKILAAIDECGFEVASLYEFNLLKEVGVPSERIIYGTSVKPLSHIRETYKQGVDRFAVDSFSEIEKVASVAPGSKVYVRVSVNDTGSVFKFSEKFGTNHENVVPMLQRAKELGLHPYGISFHVGSQASNPMAWAIALNGLSQTLVHLKDAGINIDILNLGGGYPCAYASAERNISLKEIAEHTFDEYNKLPYTPKLIMEPGRGMVATTGILVATVIGRVERKGNTWLFLDAGVYNALFETMAYQGSTRYRVTSMRTSYDSGETLFALAGPSGDSPDVITREAVLPQDIDVGDKLVFHDVGAYSIVATSRFNGFPEPKVYWI